MGNYTPTNARKHFYQIIKNVNEQKRTITVIPTTGNENDAVVIVSKREWDSIVETLYLEGNKTMDKIRKRIDDDSGYTNSNNIDWNRL